MEHDADEVLVKPMNTNDLLLQIEALLVTHEDKKRLGQGAARSSPPRGQGSPPRRQPGRRRSTTKKSPLPEATHAERPQAPGKLPPAAKLLLPESRECKLARAGDEPSPPVSLQTTPLHASAYLSAAPHFVLETLAAQHGSSLRWLERYGGFGAALRTGSSRFRSRDASARSPL